MPAEKKRSAHIGFRLLRMAGMVYLGLFAWGWLNANRLAFFPPPPSYDREVAGLFFLEVEDGERIAVRHLPLENATATVIFAHGNAEDLGDLEGYLLQMQAELRVEVYALDYRGYGLSDGKPGLRRAEADVRALSQHLLRDRGLDPARLILHGRSLGGALLLPAAAEFPVAGVVLESSLINGFQTVIQFPLYPADPLPSLRRLRRLQVPVLVLHGEADAVIPIRHGRALHAAAPRAVEPLWIPEGGHNDLLDAGEMYWDRLRGFLLETLTE